MSKTKYIIKQIKEGFILIFGEGPMSGCNAAPGAMVFPTQAHAEIAIELMEKFDNYFFYEEYQNAVRIH